MTKKNLLIVLLILVFMAEVTAIVLFFFQHQSSVKFWTKQLGTATWDAGYGVATDASGNIYVTGFMLGNVGGFMTNTGGDIFLVKYDSAGNKIWIK